MRGEEDEDNEEEAEEEEEADAESAVVRFSSCFATARCNICTGNVSKQLQNPHTICLNSPFIISALCASSSAVSGVVLASVYSVTMCC